MTRELSWHFEEDGFMARFKKLPDVEYGRLMDNVVVACVDVAVVCGLQLWLGLRANEPYKHGWWICGGRMVPGERREQTAQKVVYREIGLDIVDLGRFEDLGLTMDFVWARRAQPPVNHGCHMMGLYQMLRITEAEAGEIKMGSDWLEYKWVNISSSDLLAGRAEASGYLAHEAMCQVGRVVSQRILNPRSFLG